MTKSTGIRLYRACVRCRERKTKCDLQSIGHPGKPPCLKCHQDGLDCMLAGSRRGGDFTRFRVSRTRRNYDFDATYRVNNGRSSSRRRTGIHQHTHTRGDRATREASSDFNEVRACGGIQNPLEALQILAQAAAHNDFADGDIPNSGVEILSPSSSKVMTTSSRPQIGAAGNAQTGLESYGPVADGVLDPRVLDHLLQHYTERYHPFMPIVPDHVLSPANIHKTAVEETFLLTAILIISTKDREELARLHRGIWSYMQEMILSVALGMSATRHVGTVEGLLLLAEWVPHINTDLTSKAVPCLANDNEDNAAWMLVGLAVRQGYLLHLDSYSFRKEQDKEEMRPLADRKRLTWTFTYLSDRQISIRMGQAFWCRGPGLSTRFTADDYPTLKPKHAYEDDYAAILQSQVELTTLFGNVHDILYASKSRTVGLMRMGDYTKYLDDSAKALAAWKDTWDGSSCMNVSAHLRFLLNLQYEYLRLYVNAFAFQAVICRATDRSSGTANHDPAQATYFPHSVMASADGRHIYLAIDAAMNLLRIINEHIDPVRHLRYLPVRFYLYEIYSAVFLFKAHAFGAVSNEAHQKCTALVQTFISRLETAATGEQHIASRYSKLLSSQWFKQPSSSEQSGHHRPAAFAATTARPRNTAVDYLPTASNGDGNSIPTSLISGQRREEDALFMEDLSGIAGPGLAAAETMADCSTPRYIDSGPSQHIHAPINCLQGLSFADVDLPGLNGADLSSLAALDSYWSY
ncbi:hypothetical protein BJX64DRAFT_279100 [Aspergillus heterothallicus]